MTARSLQVISSCRPDESDFQLTQTTLDLLLSGNVATVRQVGGVGAFRRRLMEIGLVPGTHVERVGDTSFADPVRFRCRDAIVALRRVDARCVVVELG